MLLFIVRVKYIIDLEVATVRNTEYIQSVGWGVSLEGSDRVTTTQRSSSMVLSRGSNKYERVTITLVPTADEQSFLHVPTTFSATERTYAWRHFEKLEYMIVPKKISNKEIKIEMFVDPQAKGKASAAQMQKMIHSFVNIKIQTDWLGLKLAGISRASAAVPPEQMFRRGTIEEILGAQLEK